MDGLQLLLNDHRKVEGIFQQFSQGGDSQTFNQLFNQLFQELNVHAVIEEQFFYPELAKFPETRDLVPDAYEDHAEVKAALVDLAAMDNTTTDWSQKITQLRDDVLHHVQEEENDIFTKVRQRMSQQQLDELGQKLQQGKQEALNSFLITGPMQEIQRAQTLHHQGMSVEQAGIEAMSPTSAASMGGATMSGSSTSGMAGNQNMTGMSSSPMGNQPAMDDDTRGMQQGM